MPIALRLLLLEDNPSDAELILAELRRAGFEPAWERVETEQDFLTCLAPAVDIIVADYSIPQFSGLRALQLLRESGQDIPFILVSGVIGEDVAVSAIHQGAADYLLKDRLARLGSSITRALAEKHLRDEKRQAEDALRASQTMFQGLFDSSPDAIVVTNLEGQIVRVNAQVEALFGYRAGQLLGQPVEILLPERFQEVHPQHRSDYMLNPRHRPMGTRLELYGRRRDGSEFPADINLGTLATEAVLVVLATVRDITERKRAEEALQENERLLSEAQHIGRIGSWSYNIGTDSLRCSDEMYRLLDVEPDEFQHNMKGLLNLTYSADRPVVSTWIETIRAGMQTKEFEFRVLHKNGELHFIHIRGAFVYGTAPEPTRFTGTAQDVTERKLAEIQIRQQIQRLSALRRIDQTITSNYDLHVTLKTLLSEVSTQLQVDAADILLLDPDGQMLEYAAGRGFRTRANESARVPIGESYAGRAAKERRLVQIQNLKDQPNDLLLTTLLAEEDFVCYYGVPLITKGKVIGVLEVFHRVLLQPYPEWIDFLNALAGQAAIAIENATLFENLEDSNRELSQAYDATIEGWSRALDLRDKETEGHTLRVTEMTMNLARSFGFSEEELLHIRRGALLHDIGKMGVPDHILFKPEPLTEEELAIMGKHAQYAYDLLKPIAFLQPALDIPYCHHEKWDGTGYPRGLKGEAIPIAARLFTIVDVWDALTSDRPYRPAWSEAEALTYIHEQSGKHFDPQVVDLFFKVIK